MVGAMDGSWHKEKRQNAVVSRRKRRRTDAVVWPNDHGQMRSWWRCAAFFCATLGDNAIAPLISSTRHFLSFFSLWQRKRQRGSRRSRVLTLLHSMSPRTNTHATIEPPGESLSGDRAVSGFCCLLFSSLLVFTDVSPLFELERELRKENSRIRQ
jgi:hypothetical protein